MSIIDLYSAESWSISTVLCVLSGTGNNETDSSAVIVWSCCCWVPGHGDCPVASSRPSDLQQRRPDDRKCWAGNAVQSGDETAEPVTWYGQVMKLLSQERGTVRWCRVADRKWRRLGMSETGVQQSTRYSGALYCRQRCTVTPSLYWKVKSYSTQGGWEWHLHQASKYNFGFVWPFHIQVVVQQWAFIVRIICLPSHWLKFVWQFSRTLAEIGLLWPWPLTSWPQHWQFHVTAKGRLVPICIEIGSLAFKILF